MPFDQFLKILLASGREFAVCLAIERMRSSWPNPQILAMDRETSEIVRTVRAAVRHPETPRSIGRELEALAFCIRVDRLALIALMHEPPLFPAGFIHHFERPRAAC